jgi:hypothetical protein
MKRTKPVNKKTLFRLDARGEEAKHHSKLSLSTSICHMYIYMCVLDCIGYLSRFGVAPAASLFGFLHLYAGMMQTLWLGLVSCFNIYQYVEIIPPPGRGKNIFKKQPVVANKMM